MSFHERPMYAPRSPIEQTIADIAALLAALILGIPACIGLGAGLWALTGRDAGAGALLGANIGIVLISLVGLGYVATHLRWLAPLCRSCMRAGLWLVVRPRSRQPVILPAPPDGRYVRRAGQL